MKFGGCGVQTPQPLFCFEFVHHAAIQLALQELDFQVEFRLFGSLKESQKRNGVPV